MPEPALDIASLRAGLDREQVGREIHDRIGRLYPICRSITGDGFRQTLDIVGAEIPLVRREVPTGTRVFDWAIPKEWNIKDAYIKDRSGRRVVDFRASNLHVVNYSVPVRQRMSLAELRPHLFSIPDRPDWIPYKTSYYRETWGFCLTHRQLEALGDDEYDVCIDASLAPGHLTLAECVIEGRENREVLFSSHACHPSLCNDNLSSVSIAVTLAGLLARVPVRHTYRFLFNPGTIGAIAWLAANQATAPRITHGLVLACLGDRGTLHYKRTRRPEAEIDQVLLHVLRAAGADHEVREFTPDGYDERQYCSPGFDLPVGVLSRTPHGEFPEYHTSGDNMDFMDPAALADSLMTCLAAIEVIEGNGVYVNTNPQCEPQLGSRGLYAAMGGHGDAGELQTAVLWVLNMSTGTHSLLDIADRSKLPFALVRHAATLLVDRQLLTEAASAG